MPFLSRMGLQKRIVFSVILGLVVIFGFFGYLSLHAVSQSAQLSFEERITLAQTIAADIDSAISYSVAELEKMASFAIEEAELQTGNENVPGLNTCLTMCHARSAVSISQVGVVDRQGQLVGIEPHTIQDAEGGIPPQQYVLRALTEGTTIVTGGRTNSPSSATLVFVATPLRDSSGTVIGALTLEFNPLLSVSVLSPVGEYQKHGYRFELIDQDGIVLAGEGGMDKVGEISEHTEFIPPFIQEKKAAALKHEREREGDHVIALASVYALPWAVLVAQEQDTALVLPQLLRQRIILFSGIAFGVSLILALVSTRRVVKPIMTLTMAAQRIARGDLSQAISTKGEDEVGTLSRTFEEMRGKLKASQEELEAWNRTLEERVQQRTREIVALFEASQALTSNLELEAVLETISVKTRDIFPRADAGILYLYSEEKDALSVGSSFGFVADLVPQLTLRPGEDYAGKVFLSGKPELCSPAELSERIQSGLFPEIRQHLEKASVETSQPTEALCVPLLYQGQAIGSIVLYNLHAETVFSEHHVHLLEAVANQAAIAIQNARLFREASKVAALEELDRIKTEFVARASHELRTPLTSIKSLAETLVRPDLALPPREQREFLEDINSACDRLARIVTDLLTVSRIESGKITVRGAAISLQPLIDKAARRFGSQSRGRVFSAISPSDLPAVWADPDRVEDILENLLSNAVKYSPLPKPVIIKAQYQSHPFPSVTVSVSDEGIGIPASEMDKLFRRFSRVDSAAGRLIEGVGLGLYICKSYVEAMGGSIWAESIPGKGSTFSFSLRAVDEREDSA